MKNNKLKQKLRKKEYIKTFNIKCQMIYKQYQEYFENFVIDCEKNRKKEIKNLLNVMVAPMRFGKTRTAITHHIPFLFKHTNTQLIILTSPLGDILVQKERLVRKTIRNLENVEYATCPIEALEALEDGSRVVITMTNQSAWVGSKAKSLYKKCDKSKTAILVDEAHTWTTDCKENLDDVVGKTWKKKDGTPRTNFKGVLYNVVKEFAKETPYIFGLTATTNNQHNGKVKALGSMQFKVINSDFVDNLIVRELVYRISWFDKKRVRFFTPSSVNGAWNDMIQTIKRREKAINKKLSVFIESKQKRKHTEVNQHLNNILQKFKKESRLDIFESKNVDYYKSPVVVVMNSDCIRYQSLSGKIIEKNISSKQVFKDLEDLNHPLRFLVVVNMAKMGVDLPTTKMMFSFRNSCDYKLSENYGYMTESKIQLFGRLMTAYTGKSDKEFYGEYQGDVRNIDDFVLEQNMTDYWVVDNPLNRKAFDEFEDKFSCPPPTDIKDYSEPYTLLYGKDVVAKGIGNIVDHLSNNVKGVTKEITNKLNSFFGI